MAKKISELRAKIGLRARVGADAAASKLCANHSSGRIAYQAILAPQPEGGFTVTFTDLPDAITEGDSESEALFNAAEVLTLTLGGRMDEGDEIPEPSDHGGIWVLPSPSR